MKEGGRNLGGAHGEGRGGRGELVWRATTSEGAGWANTSFSALRLTTHQGSSFLGEPGKCEFGWKGTPDNFRGGNLQATAHDNFRRTDPPASFLRCSKG